MNEKFDIKVHLMQECADAFSRDIDSKVLWELLFADEFPYSIKLPIYGSQYPERYVWLNANVGETEWAQHDSKMYFKKEKDLSMYIMRWA